MGTCQCLMSDGGRCHHPAKIKVVVGEQHADLTDIREIEVCGIHRRKLVQRGEFVALDRSKVSDRPRYAFGCWTAVPVPGAARFDLVRIEMP